MKKIGIRVSEDSAEFVRQEAARRRIGEAQIWREMIHLGINRSDVVLSQLERLSKLVVQSFCMAQRLAGHTDESLVTKAREDARVLIARMGEAQRLDDGG